MASGKIFFFVTILLISEGYKVAGVARMCGPSTLTPTGTIIAPRQFTVPAVIKPLFTAQSLAQPAALAPETLASEATGKPATSLDEYDEDDVCDSLLYLLITKILDGKKSSGKKPASSLSGCEAGLADDYEGVYPAIYSSGGAPVPFCPYGAGPSSGSPGGPTLEVTVCAS